jgi:hypothetical protein
MTREKLSRTNVIQQPLLMAGIPVNRRHSYEGRFFKEGIPVLQGIAFPLKKTSFETGKVRLDKGAIVFGAPRNRVDSRTVSYASE